MAVKRQKSPGPEEAECKILYKCLQMSKMQGFTEATAIHFRIKNEQQSGDESKESKQDGAYPGYYAAPHSGNDGCAEQGFQQSQNDRQSLGRRKHEIKACKLEILLHNESRSDRVHKL